MYEKATNRFRRLTALTIAGVLLASCFAGCKKDENPSGETTTAPTPTETTSVAQTEPSTTPSEAPTEAPLELKGTVLAKELNVREGVGTKYKAVSKFKEGDNVVIHQVQDLNGVEWGLTDEGWICLTYVQLEGEPDKILPADSLYDITDPITGVVIATELNIRTGPGIGYEKVKSVKKGEKLTITELNGNWGKTEEGWVNTIFAYFEGTIDAKTVKGVVDADQLNVRTGPGIAYESIKKITDGTEVEVIKQVTVNDSTWGYIGDGWVSMEYIKEK